MAIFVGFKQSSASWTQLSGRTTIVWGNQPSNGTGVLRQAGFYVKQAITGLVIGTFYCPNPALPHVLVCQDLNSMGDFPSIGFHTCGVTLNVVTGGFIGCYFATGKLGCELTNAEMYDNSGDYIVIGVPHTYSLDGIGLLLWGTDTAFPPPSVYTNPATLITKTTATLNGQIDSTLEGAIDIWFEYGLDISYGSVTPTQHFSLPPIPPFVSANLIGLVPGTTYHFRCVAQNNAGIGYGGDGVFITRGLPTVTTLPATGVT